ncbi:peptidylprolyl isomerase [Prauserella shujinwangii]|uniref:Peptidyl-prolyl cis-trans isomerase n=1 Tax=Prauserella shujinwangii TaxID=1453103 RepID=A0A2T0LRA4_9PSEU|nr:FKBP-type peptidyl-prolyl cis-trans isomerase [Prauserella shujinwangii]PRX46031.1 peptidylprolyl isomerase [Prauserella shujinwangii]
MRKAGTIIVVAAATLVLAACTPSREQPSDLPPGTDPSPSLRLPPPQSTPPPQDQVCAADDITVTGEYGQEPQVRIPEDCAAPTELLRRDLEDGLGEGVDLSGTIEVNYALFTWSDGQLKDSSFGEQRTLSVTLGQGDVIEGFNEALVGMRQQGRRLAVVPPDLGYGEQSGHPLQDETLVFVIDAVRINPTE